LNLFEIIYKINYKNVLIYPSIKVTRKRIWKIKIKNTKTDKKSHSRAILKIKLFK